VNYERRRDIENFSRLALPGMTLLAKLPEPKPVEVKSLFKRCACGQKISGTRARCMACQQEVLRDLAGQIQDQELLDAMLDRSFPEMRDEMLRSLTPYLSFVPVRKT
jgi:hypothetical protein